MRRSTDGRAGGRRLVAYAGEAEHYDERTASFQPWRDLAVDVLPLLPGDRVIDVGCGTGLCFARIEEAVGPGGGIVGIDESREMLALARLRVERNGWRNVDLILAPAHLAKLPHPADAALFCAVHDILQDPSAVDGVLAGLRPGSAVSAVGGRWAHPCLVAFNLMIRALHAPYIGDFAGFERPWALLARGLGDLQVDDIAGGGGYCLLGHTPARASRGRSDAGVSPISTR